MSQRGFVIVVNSIALHEDVRNITSLHGKGLSVEAGWLGVSLCLEVGRLIVFRSLISVSQLHEYVALQG